MIDFINGQQYKEMIIAAAGKIDFLKQEINELNVFPVPDGDTGTNMALTLSQVAKELENVTSEHIGQISVKVASVLLRSARGNSGVILSLLFRGISTHLKNKETADGKDFALALKSGVEAAYRAVMKPTEGTILTVARLASEAAVERSKECDCAEEIFQTAISEANVALDNTPELLPVLKQAGVVDAGGKGLCVIFDAMMSSLRGEFKVAATDDGKPSADAAQTDEIAFEYCTEFVVMRSSPNSSAGKLRAYLETIGDSVAMTDDDEHIKCHVHTNDPGVAIQKALTFGRLVDIKVENIREQHTCKLFGVEMAVDDKNAAGCEPSESLQKAIVSAEKKDFGFVAVSCGEGISSVFTDLGTDAIVFGGQTMNPSAEDIYSAIEKVHAETVFVFPNNKNIIMSADIAKQMIEENGLKKVVVVPTTTIPQGVACLVSFDPDSSAEENEQAMTEAISKVSTIQLTFAARDSVFDGKTISKDQILALLNGKMNEIGDDLFETALKVLDKIEPENGIITVFSGCDVSDEDSAEFEKKLSEHFSDWEFTFIPGGQPVYYYIISVE